MGRSNFVLFRDTRNREFFVAKRISGHTKASYQVLPHFISFHDTEAQAWEVALKVLAADKKKIDEQIRYVKTNLKNSTARRKRLVETISPPTHDLYFKIYRDPLFNPDPYYVVVCPETKDDFEPYFLDQNNSWPTLEQAKVSIEKAIRSGEGL